MTHDLPPGDDRLESVISDLELMTRLHRIGALFVSRGELHVILEEVLDTALAVTEADKGNIKLLDPHDGQLHIAAQRGFDTAWLDFWEHMLDVNRGTCGEALIHRERVIVEDVLESHHYRDTPGLATQLQAGVRAIQSTPLIGRCGRALGIFSTHYARPWRPDERSLRTLDLLARQAADILEAIWTDEILRKSAAELNEAQRMAHVGSWEWDAHRDVIVWSHEFCNIFGLDPQRPPPNYDEFLRHFTGESADRLDVALKRSLHSGDPFELELRLDRRDSGRQWILWCGEVKRTREGEISGVRATAQNITERKRAETALQRAAWEKTIHNRIAGIFLTFSGAETYDAVLQVLLETLNSHFGFCGFLADNGDLVIPTLTRNAWRECRMADKAIVFPPHVWAQSIWGEAIREHRTLASSGPFQTPPGHVPIDNFLTAPIVSGDKPIGLLAVANREGGYGPAEIARLAGIAAYLAPILTVRRERDRQEEQRRQAEEEISRLKNYLSRVIDSIPSILIGLDRDQTVTHWNRSAEETSGIAAGSAVGRPVGSLLPVFAPWIDHLHDDLALGRSASLEKVLIEREGERCFFDLALYPIAAEGEGDTVLRIFDVTKRTLIDELLIQTEKMMSLGGLAAGMAHEINNPLGIVSQAVQTVTRRLDSELRANREAAQRCGLDLEAMTRYLADRQIDRMLAAISEGSKRAGEIVRSMLEFSRKSSAQRIPTELPPLIERALELAGSDYDLKKKFDFRAIAIERDFAELPAVPVVVQEIEQVLLNLLRNAAQAMGSNPPERPPRIEVRLRRETDWAVIEITDNGPGMSKEVRRRLFEPFFTTKEPGVGTGLGLSVSHTIITANHGGEIAVAAAPDSGTRFTVRLPLTGATPQVGP